MSLAFNSGNSGIIQRIERTIYGQDAVGRISGNATLLAQWTADVNLALDKVHSIIFRADGTWQFDDGNHTTNPTITTNLVASQRSYDFTEDSSGNLLLEIARAYVKNNGIFSPLEPADELEEVGFYDGQESTGLPYQYAKKGSTLLLDPVPNTNVTAGLKVEISREGSYFTVSDTTKKPGFNGLFHEYLVIEPCLNYAGNNNLGNVQWLQIREKELRDGIIETYTKRAGDERDVLEPEPISYL